MSYSIDIFFIISFFLFISYFTLVTIFGFMLFFILNKERIKFSLLNVLICFTIGLITHIVYSTIILALQILNFFSIYLPFIIIDICFITYFVKKNCRIRNFTLLKISNLLKKNLTNLLLIFVIFFLLYTLQSFFINENLAYPYSDPYHWFQNIWVVHETGAINYNYIEGNTHGFILFCANIISVTDNYYIIYFFLKYLPIFLSGINLLVLFELAKKLFKKKINVFFTLSIYLSMNYIFYRYQMPVPSTLATTLGFLFLLFLREGSIPGKVSRELRLVKISSNNLNKNDILFRGIVLSGIFMAHPLYGMFYLSFYFLFEFYLFFVYLKFNKKASRSKILFHFKFLKNIFSIFLIFVLMLIPWYIGASIHLDYPLYRAYFHYISPLNLSQSLFDIQKIEQFFYYLGREIFNNPFYRNIDDFFSNHIMNILNFYNDIDFYKQTIGTGIILIVISIFLPFNKFFNFNEKQKNIVRFAKFTFIFTFLFYLLTGDLNFRETLFLSNLSQFLIIYVRRLLELFEGFWAILFVLSFNFILTYFIKLLKKNKSIKKILKKNNLKKILSIPVISIIIFLSGFYYTSNYQRIYYKNHFSDYHIDVVLFAGNYFNENPLAEETVLLVQDWNLNQLYHLTETIKLGKIYYTFDYNSTHILNSTDYIEFKDTIDSANVTYILFNVVFTDEDFKNNLYSDFNLLYRNAGYWIFAMLK